MNSLEKRLRRDIKTERRFREMETRLERRATKLQAAEYERRLQLLNHQNERIGDVLDHSVTADKFDDYKTTQETALKIALERQDDRINVLENWKARATGIGVVLVLLSGAAGAAIMKALGA